jgi:hypothetical protein|tara:strand:+ start:26555 stop:27046 length:492 start_codon:yes stop_codon:yes gene_type:complete
MQATIPTSLIDQSYETFPEGTYSGDIDSAAIRDPKGDGSWLTLKLGLDGVAPNEGTNDPGRTRFTGDITVATDGYDVREISDFSDRNVPFPVRRAGGLLAGLAEGLGIVQRNGTNMVAVDVSQVLDALTEGNFSGERVAFEVTHYTPASGKTREQFNQFGVSG